MFMIRMILIKIGKLLKSYWLFLSSKIVDDKNEEIIIPPNESQWEWANIF